MKFITDENVDARIVAAVERLLSEAGIAFDAIRAQDEMRGADDRTLLAWAASQQRIVITFDKNTLVGLAWERVHAGDAMPGVIALKRPVDIGRWSRELRR